MRGAPFGTGIIRLSRGAPGEARMWTGSGGRVLVIAYEAENGSYELNCGRGAFWLRDGEMGGCTTRVGDAGARHVVRSFVEPTILCTLADEA